MSNSNQTELAHKVYNSLCAAIEELNWKYNKVDSTRISFEVRGDDLPMSFIIKIDEDRQLVRLFSPLPFKIKEDKMAEACVAVCTVNYKLTIGSFSLDISDGTLVFRVTNSFRSSVISEELLEHIINYSCAFVDKYNDKFLMLNSGLSLADFLKAID
ncbi:MAG: YbjN domain-containing protein [Clostridia bacterium]|nr:YbjN domain-containing protein [Clostridia bacterium]